MQGGGGRENPVQFTVENSACVENSDTVHGQWGGVSPVLLMSSNLGLMENSDTVHGAESVQGPIYYLFKVKYSFDAIVS